MPNPLSEDSHDGAILLTGATGLLGSELLRRLLEQTDRTIVALTRRPLEVQDERIVELHADLVNDEVLPVPDQAISRIIHCAASVSFTLPIEDQRAVNVEGTRKMLALAEKLGGLERFVHVSTCYVAGMFEGTFGPEDLDRGQEFRNTYEQSKFESEMLVRQSGLPVQIMRPAVVVGDRTTGRTNSFNVIYQPMRAYSLGKMTMAPGNREAPIDVVTVDYIADAIMALQEAEPGRTHLLAAGEDAAKMGDFVDRGAEFFGCQPGQLISRKELDDIIATLPDELREKAELSLERSAPMLPYFDVKVHYRDPWTREFLAERGIRPAKLDEYFENIMRFAVEANWGRPMQVAA